MADHSPSTTEDDAMKCEIKHLDSRYDDEDNQYFCERKVEVKPPTVKKDWWRLFAFCIVRHYDSDGDLESIRLYVNPQPIRNLLCDFIENFASDPIDVSDVQIDAPYHSLFHVRKKIESEGRKRFYNDEESLAQLNILLDWIKTRFEREIGITERCQSRDLKVISFNKLWVIFSPGTLVCNTLQDETRALRVRRVWYDEGDAENDAGLNLDLTYVDYDGKKLGIKRMHTFIWKFPGNRPWGELSTIPLDLIDNAAEHYLQYDGIAYKEAKCDEYTLFSATGRVMVDCKTNHRLEPNGSFSVLDLDGGEDRGLTDEEAMMANARVRGFSFSLKRFLEFSVNKLKPIRWNSECFDELVLDPGVKKTVRALVTVHSQERDKFDDIVEGKGQGLICLLHGLPGVGKTLTAECAAEYVKRPLYMVSSGDLGITATDLDKKLAQIMDLSATWRAVFLIDEADVFLERRSALDIHRNAIVSVFLRVLEYYTGILFLASNRVTTFDLASRSGIQVPIRYTHLTTESRGQIGRNFLGRVPGGADVGEEAIQLLSKHDLNGRQIKNVVKAAESLAAFEGVRADLEQLEQVARMQAAFEKDLNLTNVGGVDYTVPMK